MAAEKVSVILKLPYKEQPNKYEYKNRFERLGRGWRNNGDAEHQTATTAANRTLTW